MDLTPEEIIAVIETASSAAVCAVLQPEIVPRAPSSAAPPPPLLPTTTACSFRFLFFLFLLLCACPFFDSLSTRGEAAIILCIRGLG